MISYEDVPLLGIEVGFRDNGHSRDRHVGKHTVDVEYSGELLFHNSGGLIV